MAANVIFLMSDAEALGRKIDFPISLYQFIRRSLKSMTRLMNKRANHSDSPFGFRTVPNGFPSRRERVRLESFFSFCRVSFKCFLSPF
ncbi:hypothetical protein CEXT_262261 [Caerostris extrusa]|uniref:Uncharacterized protein n=1 Tax=Caerostris extrusa TaxID=172846 RepID=A0AAV4NHK6_CAEEX|nr:hypothetical protein CEXT_262261 [Caerostris extrusa]